jgi:hypothetical protein
MTESERPIVPGDAVPGDAGSEGTAAAASGEPVAGLPGERSTAVAALTADEIEPAARRRALWRVARTEVRGTGLRNMLRPATAVRWVVETVVEVAPHLPIRDYETLRRHHGGLTGDALADRLVRNAARATAGIGAASGGIAAAEWVATPTLLTAPVLLAAETVAVVAVELKLIAELHEVFGRPVAGTAAQRGSALLRAWAQRRGVDPLASGRGVAAALSTAARKELRERLLRRFGRNLSTFGPLLTGAAVAGYLNRRATVALGAEVCRELRRRSPRRALPDAGC